MRRIPIVSEILPWLIGLAAVSILLLPWLPVLSAVSFAFFVFLAFFFRDPERQVQAQPEAILSPADGHVLEIKEMEASTWLGQPAWRVGVFLSLSDVHLNRSPIEGQVVCIKYEKGKFRPAFASSAPTENERNSIGIEGERGRVLVVQIAGILARRIECWVNAKDAVRRGQRIGLIRFGSRTELYLPKANVELLVQTGNRVKAGETVIGRWVP